MIKAGQKEMAEVNKMPWEEGRYLMSVCHDMVSNKKKGHTETATKLTSCHDIHEILLVNMGSVQVYGPLRKT